MRYLFQPYVREWIARPRFTLLLALVAIAAALRFYGLSRESLWLDEACSWHTATHETLHDVAFRDVAWHLHPPGYFLFLHSWIAVFGDSEVSLRTPSAISGVLSVVLMYLLGCRWYGPREGLVSAALTAVLLYPIWYSQEARPYGVLLALTLGSTLAWTSLIAHAYQRTRPRFRAVVAYTILVIAVSYVHYFGLMLVVLQGGTLGVLVLSRRQSVLWVTAIYAIVITAYTPWWASFWAQLRVEGMGHPAPLNGPVATTTAWLGAYFNYRSPHFAWTAALGAAILALMLVVGLIDGHRAVQLGREGRRLACVRGVILMSWLVIPFAFAYGQSFTSASIYTQRNLIVSAPVVYLLTARGIAQLPNWRGLFAAGAVFLFGAALMRTVFASGYYVQAFKDQYREASLTMLTEARELPNAVLGGTGYNRSAFDYYLRRFADGRRLDLWGGTDGDVELYRRALAERDARYMLYGIAQPGIEPEFERYLAQTLRPLKQYNFRNVSVLLLERPRL